MVVVGGRRTRFVYDSVYNALNEGLEALGWLDPNRGHRPVTLLYEPLPDTQEVQLNTVALSDGPMFDREAELGSMMSESEYGFFVDVYAESGNLGRDLANDIRDLIQGRHGGRTGPVFTLYDYSLATPSSIGWLEVERVNVFREDNPTRPWERFWYSIRFDVVDAYMPDE